MQHFSEEEKDLLNNYIELFENDKEISDEVQNKTREIINKFWNNTEFSLKDLLDFYATCDMVTRAPIEVVRGFFARNNVFITKKDIQRGRTYVLQRVLRKYHKPQLREALLDFFYHHHKNSIFSMAKDYSTENLEFEIETYGYHRALWTGYTLENENKEIIKILQDEYSKDFTHALINYYLFYETMNYHDVIKAPDKLVNDTLDPNEVLKENKKIKSKMNREAKQKQNLQKEVYELQQQKKQMRGEIHSLYEGSLNEIEALKQQLQKQQEETQSEREMLFNLIQSLTDKNNALQEQLHRAGLRQNNNSLIGKNVCFVGGNKERHYREVVEKYGGEFYFVAEDDFNKIRGAISKSDVVFFLKEVAGHHLFRETYSSAKDFSVPFYYLNSKGKCAFENELIHYMNTLETKKGLTLIYKKEKV